MLSKGRLLLQSVFCSSGPLIDVAFYNDVLEFLLFCFFSDINWYIIDEIIVCEVIGERLQNLLVLWLFREFKLQNLTKAILERSRRHLEQFLHVERILSFFTVLRKLFVCKICP